MISSKLKNIFLISIPVFVVHGLEEYLTGFYEVDPFSKFAFRYFEGMPTYQATFLLFQVMVWLLLVISFLLISGGRWALRLMIILGLVYIFELHHIVKAFVSFDYYPGLITALLFPVIGFTFWKELVRNFKAVGRVKE